MRTIFILSLLLLINSSILSKQYPGYIINLQRDTVNGNIFITSEQKVHHEIGFSSSDKKNPNEVFKPGEILGFEFLGSRFISAEVPVEEVFEKTPEEEFKIPTSRIVNAFLAVDLEGQASLYYFKDDSRKAHYYIKKQGGDYLELNQYEYYESRKDPAPNTNKNYKVTNRKYLNDLISLLSDCDQIRKDIEKTRLIRKDLVQLLKKYNNCETQDALPLYINPIANQKLVNWFVFAGISRSNLRFEALKDPWQSYYLTKPSQPDLFTPFLGINARFYLSKYQSRWFLSTGFWNKQHVLRGDYRDGSETGLANGNYDNIKYNTKVIQFTLPIGIGHNINFGNVTANINFGALASFSILPDNILTRQQYVNNEPIFSEENSLLFTNFSNVEYGTYGSIGISYKGWSIESYISYGTGLLSSSGLVALESNSMKFIVSRQIY